MFCAGHPTVTKAPTRKTGNTPVLTGKSERAYQQQWPPRQHQGAWGPRRAGPPPLCWAGRPGQARHLPGLQVAAGAGAPLHARLGSRLSDAGRSTTPAGTLIHTLAAPSPQRSAGSCTPAFRNAGHGLWRPEFLPRMGSSSFLSFNSL